MTKVTGPWMTAPATQAVFDALEAVGHQGFFVGGCVRNALLEVSVADVDIATSAMPEQVIEAMTNANLKSIPTGIEHGTVTVMSGGIAHEVTTFRHDVETDGRHAQVTFSTSLNEDAARRDFTMNGLYADRHGDVTDPVGGLADIMKRQVRFIGDANLRISEDYLRILRFFRFYAWFGDAERGIDADGLAACAAGLDGLSNLSAERVGSEMKKLLAAPNPSPAIAAMAQAGILAQVMPEADAKALPILVHLEGEVRPKATRRMACLSGHDLKNHWRLSKSEANEVSLLRKLVSDSAGIPEVAYRHGASTARDTAFLRAALFEQPLSSNLDREIKQGENAMFPVKATDLMPEFQQEALGKKLRELEGNWISSGFSLTKTQLLK